MISLVKFVVTIISVISIKKRNHFEVATFRGSLLLAFTNTCTILSLLSGGRYLGNSTVSDCLFCNGLLRFLRGFLKFKFGFPKDICYHTNLYSKSGSSFEDD